MKFLIKYLFEKHILLEHLINLVIIVTISVVSIKIYDKVDINTPWYGYTLIIVMTILFLLFMIGLITTIRLQILYYKICKITTIIEEENYPVREVIQEINSILVKTKKIIDKSTKIKE